jgi:hypothetical protein
VERKDIWPAVIPLRITGPDNHTHLACRPRRCYRYPPGDLCLRSR